MFSIEKILSHWASIARWEHYFSGPVPRKVEDYHPSAPPRHKPAAPITAYINNVPYSGRPLKILYHGVGRDKPGAEALARGGKNSVYVYDPFNPDPAVRRLPDGPFDEIHSHYTLHMVGPPEGRRILKDIFDRLALDGTAFISVRRDLYEYLGKRS
jgi:rubredoxin